jgi:hypothetical protein
MMLRLLLLLLAATLFVIWRGARPPAATEPVGSLPRGGRVGHIERCGIHGIAFDADNEVCPACAQETFARKS